MNEERVETSTLFSFTFIVNKQQVIRAKYGKMIRIMLWRGEL